MSSEKTTLKILHGSTGNGIVCPDCHHELYDECPDYILRRKPIHVAVRCDACGFQGARTNGH